MLLFHTACGVLALLSGTYVLLTPKGTRVHRLGGRTYAAAMYVLCATSFALHDLGGVAGTVFHIMSVVNAVIVTRGLWFVLRHPRRPNWLTRHYTTMSYSYYGLLMATDSHLLGYVPLSSMWAKALVLWAMPFVVARVLVARYAPRAARVTAGPPLAAA